MRLRLSGIVAGFLALTLTGSGLALSSRPVHAQKPAAAKGGRKAGGPGALQRLNAALAKISLTAEQKPKVDAVVQQATSEARANKGLPEDERKAKNREVAKTAMDKLEGILSPEQYKQFKHEIRAGRGDKRKPGGAGKPKKPADN
jgi:Spy/CpxP family protein refolding chaperone